MLERMELGMREVANAAVREKMEANVDLAKLDGHEDDGEYVLAVLETAPDEYRLRDSDAPEDSCFVEPDDDETLIRVYMKSLACMVGGRLRNPDEGTPSVLTENGNLVMKNALLSEELQVGLSDEELLDGAIARSEQIESELQHQLFQIEQHPYYSEDSFLSEGASTGSPFTSWKLSEQMRLNALLEGYQNRDLFKGKMSFKIHAASGLKKGHHCACRIRIGPNWDAQTEIVKVDKNGVATWDAEIDFNFDGDPHLMATIMHMKADGSEKAYPDCLVIEILRNGGPHHKGHNPTITVGSSRQDNTRQLWSPPPHFKQLNVEVDCGWKTEHKHTKHTKKGDTTAFVSLQVQYSFRAKEVLPPAKTSTEDAHLEFRMLARKLGDFLEAEPESSDMRATAAFAWLLDTYAETYGVGMPFRRLYDLRVHLSRFELTATSCVRVNLDLQRLQQESGEVSQQLWTHTEREIFDECRIHVESLLSESFTTINASFDDDVDLESAVQLFRTVVSARDEPYDEQLFTLLVTGADRVVDGVLGYGRHITPRSVTTLLHVVEHEINEYDTRFRFGLPEGLPERLMDHMLDRCKTALTEIRAAVAHHWEDALLTYDAALSLADQAEHLLEKPWLADIPKLFAPALEAFVNHNEIRLCEWAKEAADQDDWVPLSDEEMHSSSVNDLVSFLLRTAGEFEGMTTMDREAKVINTVMTYYSECVANSCHHNLELLGCEGPKRKRSKSFAKAKAKVAAKAKHDKADEEEAGEEPEPEASGDDPTICALDTFWVGVNNIYVLGETHCSEFSVEPGLIMPALDEIPDDDDDDAADKLADAIDVIGTFFLETQRSMRHVYRVLIDSVVDAELVRLENMLSQINHKEDGSDAWAELYESIENFLGAGMSLYANLFSRLLRQLFLGVFGAIERALSGALELLHAPSSGHGLTCLFDGVVDTLTDIFCADGVGIPEAEALILTLKVSKFLKYHSQPTASLVIQYEANAAHSAAQSPAGAVTDQASPAATETSRLVSDQQKQLVTVLELRAEAHHAEDAEAKEDNTLAANFLVTLGSAAFGSPPLSLGLPRHELVVATVRCRFNGEFGTMYVCTSYVCFEHAVGDAEHTLSWPLVQLLMARKDGDGKHHLRRTKSGLRRDVELYLSTGKKSALFDGFDHAGVRDGTLAKIRELALGLGAEFDGHSTSYTITIFTADGDRDGLDPSSSDILMQLVGENGASDELVFRSDVRSDVSPSAVLKLHHERRANEDPWGELVQICVQLKSTSKKAAYLRQTPSWKVTEVQVHNTSDGSLASFRAIMGWTVFGVEPVSLWKDSPSADPDPDAEAAPRPVVTTVVEELWENQRRKPLKGFSAEWLFASDPPPFSDSTGAPRYKESVNLPHPSAGSAGGISWAWLSDWELEATQDTDAEGWAFAMHWNKAWHTERGRSNLVRHRRWFRVRKATPPQEVAAADVEEGVPPENPADV